MFLVMTVAAFIIPFVSVIIQSEWKYVSQFSGASDQGLRSHSSNRQGRGPGCAAAAKSGGAIAFTIIFHMVMDIITHSKGNYLVYSPSIPALRTEVAGGDLYTYPYLELLLEIVFCFLPYYIFRSRAPQLCQDVKSVAGMNLCLPRCLDTDAVPSFVTSADIFAGCILVSQIFWYFIFLIPGFDLSSVTLSFLNIIVIAITLLSSYYLVDFVAPPGCGELSDVDRSMEFSHLSSAFAEHVPSPFEGPQVVDYTDQA
jgi:hypothetical protein